MFAIDKTPSTLGLFHRLPHLIDMEMETRETLYNSITNAHEVAKAGFSHCHPVPSGNVTAARRKARCYDILCIYITLVLSLLLGMRLYQSLWPFLYF